MKRSVTALTIALAGFVGSLYPAIAQQTIEDELVLITPVAKTLTDPALAAFVKFAKEKWNVTVKASALAAGTPVAYGRITEWKGRPEADIFWGGESALFDKLAEQGLLAKLNLPKDVMDAIPASIGKPKAIPLKDPKGFWTGTVLEPYGLVYHPKVLQRLGVPEPKDWDDLLHPKLKGNVAQCAPTRSSSSHATYEVILQRDGDKKGWEWLQRLGGNTGIFTARSRDVPSVVAKGEFAAGFAVPSYMGHRRLAGCTRTGQLLPRELDFRYGNRPRPRHKRGHWHVQCCWPYRRFPRQQLVDAGHHGLCGQNYLPAPRLPRCALCHHG